MWKICENLSLKTSNMYITKKNNFQKKTSFIKSSSYQKIRITCNFAAPDGYNSHVYLNKTRNTVINVINEDKKKKKWFSKENLFRGKEIFTTLVMRSSMLIFNIFLLFSIPNQLIWLMTSFILASLFTITVAECGVVIKIALTVFMNGTLSEIFYYCWYSVMFILNCYAQFRCGEAPGWAWLFVFLVVLGTIWYFVWFFLIRPKHSKKKRWWDRWD